MTEQELRQELNKQSELIDRAIDGWGKSVKREMWMVPVAFIFGLLIGLSFLLK